MSSHGSRDGKSRASHLPREQMLKLNYEFATHVIVSFQTSKAAYVQSFLRPVNAEADAANENHETMKYPIGSLCPHNSVHLPTCKIMHRIQL